MNSTRRVLLVDDEPDILATIGKYLELEGFEVVKAVDGEQAVAIATDGAQLIDVVILDLMLPKQSGLQVCEALRRHQRSAGIPIILYTGKGQDDVVASLGTDNTLLRQWGANAYVSKLESAEGLVRQIRTLLNAPAPQPRPAAEERGP